MGTPIHGSGATLYLSPGTGAAIPISEQTDYSIELDHDLQDVSSLGQTWGRSVRGLNKWSGSFSGNFDIASKSLWLAGVSTAAQKLYLYPQASVPTAYYYGMAFIKLNRAVAGGVAAKATSGFSAAGDGELALN